MRVNALFPIGSGINDSHLGRMIYYNCLNVYFLISAFWLFALKYHETAIEIVEMLKEENKQLDVKVSI